jgi:hypothetical protein
LTGTSPTRFIALFTRTANPINLATDSSPVTHHDTANTHNTVVEEDEDGHPIIVVPPAVVEDLTDEEKKEREGYATFVWRTVVDLEGVSVELLGGGDAAKAQNRGKEKGKGKEGEVDGEEMGRIPEDDELAKGDEELRTIEAMDLGHEHDGGGGDVEDEGFAIDPALSAMAPVAPDPAPTKIHQHPRKRNRNHLLLLLFSPPRHL